MANHHIPIDDLYGLITPVVTQYQNTNDVHFSEAGYQLLGKQVADTLLKTLGK